MASTQLLPLLDFLKQFQCRDPESAAPKPSGARAMFLTTAMPHKKAI